MEKRKALTHPYPNIIEKINKFGYDPKQLHHLARLNEFIERYTQGIPLEKCYMSQNKDTLIAIKQGKNIETNKNISLEDAIKLADRLVNNISYMKNQYISNEETIDEYGINVLNEVKYELLKKYFIKNIKNY